MNYKENAIRDSYWVIPERFMAGAYPSAIRDDEAHLKAGWLIQNGFSFFLDLTEPGEYGLEPYAPLLLRMTAERLAATWFVTVWTAKLLWVKSLLGDKALRMAGGGHPRPKNSASLCLAG
jgi:hypothetical protein